MQSAFAMICQVLEPQVAREEVAMRQAPAFLAASKLDRRFLSDPRGVTASWAEKDGL